MENNVIGKIWSVFPLCGKTYCTNKVGIDAQDCKKKIIINDNDYLSDIVTNFNKK